jgi:DNA end-binding protein Ku
LTELEPRFERVRQAPVAQNSAEVLPATSVTKGYEFAKNRYVSLTNEEMKSLAVETSTEMSLLEFVRLGEIDPAYFETSYYVRPEEPGETAYALLYQALQNTGLVALGQFASHGREHVVAIRPGKRGIIAHTLFFSNEVRAAEEHRAELDRVKPNELALSEQLIRSLESPFEPEKYHDTYRERLEALIAAKVEGKAVRKAEAPPKRKPVIDIAEALRESLAQLKKPAQKAEQPAAKTARRGSGKAGAQALRKSAG